ncbi:MAG: agmatinase [Bacteroidota bacterium]
MYHPTTLLGIPFDANSSFVLGASKGPAALRAALHNGSANFTNQNGLDLSIVNFWSDSGDLHFPSDDPEQAFHTIKNSASQLLDNGQRLISIGGDHSITYPLVAAYAKKYPNLHLLQIDAHSDLYDDFEGNPYSHASPFARIMERGLAQSLTQIGVRTLTAHQRAQADRFGVRIIEMKDFDVQDTLELEGPLYISIDLDGFDPAYAPGVAHYEPGGLTVREVLTLLDRIKVPIVGADIMELNPARDHQGMTAMLSAKLAKELIEMVGKA